MDALTVIEKVSAVYKLLAEVKAVALFGSRARGNATDFSDINLMAIESAPPSQSTRAQVLSQLADPQTPSACREIPIPADSFEVSGIHVCVWHIAEDLVCERVSSVLKNRRLEDSIIVGILHESRILWDPQTQLLAWKNIVSPVPSEYKRSVVPIMFSEVVSGLESLQNVTLETNLFYIHHEMIEVIKTLYEIIFLDNGYYFTLNQHIDDAIRCLNSVPDGFVKHVESILSLDFTPKGIQSRWRRICFLAQLVGNLLESQNFYNLKSGFSQLKRIAPFLFDFSE